MVLSVVEYGLSSVIVLVVGIEYLCVADLFENILLIVQFVSNSPFCAYDDDCINMKMKMTKTKTLIYSTVYHSIDSCDLNIDIRKMVLQ